MGFNSANMYVGSFGTKPENVEVPIIMERNPTPMDTNFPIGKRWINRLELSEYSLTRLTSPQGVMTANWTLLGEGDELLPTITGNEGGTLFPEDDNWNIVGQFNGSIPVMQTNGVDSTLSIEDRTSTTAFVVDSSSTPGQRGTFSTIQSAIDAAPAGATVFIKDGTYTESLTLKAGVNLCCYGFAGFTPTTTIRGKLSFSEEGAVTITGLRLQTPPNPNADYCISITGSAASRIYLNQCYLNAATFTHIEMTSSSSGAHLRIIDSWCATNTAAFGFFNISGAGSLTMFGVNVLDPVPTENPSVFSSSGMLLLRYSVIRFPILTSGTGRISATNVEFNTFITDIVPLIIEATAVSNGNYLRSCTLLSGNERALIVNSSLNMNLCGIYSNFISPIDGTGIIDAVGTSYMYGMPLLSSTGLTVNRSVAFDPGNLYGNWSGTAPAAGYVGEQISSFVRDTSAVDIPSGTIVDITSIVLTPGVWDVSGLVMFTGMILGTRQNASIGTQSATIPNISYGNNTASAVFTSTDEDDVSLAIPSYRQLVPVSGGNITMYLIARATYTDPAPPTPPATGPYAQAYGRISATRVC